jgi:hypothetical protein
MEKHILMVIDYGVNPGETYRVTFQPMHVAWVRAAEKLEERQGLALTRVLVKVIEEDVQELFITEHDLRTLEEAVGIFGIDM